MHDKGIVAGFVRLTTGWKRAAPAAYRGISDPSGLLSGADQQRTELQTVENLATETSQIWPEYVINKSSMLRNKRTRESVLC